MQESLDEAFERQIRKEFLGEAEELLQKVEKALLHLASNAGDKDVVLNELFRLVHTIKGSALSVGFAGLGRFAHTYENLLDQLRSQQLAFSLDKLSVLTLGMDQLRDFVVLLRLQPRETLDVSEACKAIEALTRPSPATAKIAATPAFNPESLPRVLICDDEPDIVDVFGEALGTICEVIPFSSSHKALEYLQLNPVDLILTDLKMPELSGRELIEQLRKTDPDTLVVFVSGQAERADMIACMHLGAFDFIEKPASLDELRFTVKRALRHRLLVKAMTELLGRVFRVYMRASKVGTFADLIPSGHPAATDLKVMEEELAEIGRICNLAMAGSSKLAT